MVSRRASLGLVALLAVGLTGCAGTPAPDPSGSPSPAATRFASEEEAFAAAEELYRSHVDGLNAYHAGDSTYDPGRYLSGEALQEEKDVLQQMAELNLTVEGAVVVHSLARASFEEEAGAVTVGLQSCLDYSGTRILDSTGKDVTPERENLIALDVSIATVDSARLAIVRSTVSESVQCV